VIPHRPEDWHPAAFILGCGLSIALLMSWFFEPTRSLWLTFDEKVFWALNDSLAWGRDWQVFWAIANNRAVDIVAALSMIGLFAHFVLRKARDRMDFFVAVGLMLTGLIYVGSQLRIPTKDLSSDSFPGDHATVLFICAGVATYYLPRAYAAATWAMAIVFMAPRLMGGAHWMTDYLVGSAAVAGFVLFYVFATPLHSIMTDRLELLIRRYRTRWRDWINRRRF